MSEQEYPKQHRDRRFGVAAALTAAIVGGVVGVNKVQNSGDQRPACTAISPLRGEGSKAMTLRIEVLEPAGETVVYRFKDGAILKGDDGFPSYRGVPLELNQFDQVAVEHANPVDCANIGGTVLPKIVEVDRN